MELKDLLRERRGARSQAEIAEELGFTQPLIAKWESGLCQPSLGSVDRIAKVYGISARRLHTLIVERIKGRKQRSS